MEYKCLYKAVRLTIYIFYFIYRRTWNKYTLPFQTSGHLEKDFGKIEERLRDSVREEVWIFKMTGEKAKSHRNIVLRGKMKGRGMRERLEWCKFV